MLIDHLVRAAVILTVLCPVAASALSCEPPTPAGMIEALSETGRAPVVIAGMTLDEGTRVGDAPSVLEPPSRHVRDTPLEVAYRIAGVHLHADGRQEATVVTAKLTDMCVGQWCGRFPGRHKVATFVLWEEGDDIVGVVGPCGGSVHPRSTAAELAAIQRCLAEGQCR